jgi:uroporphyrinogen-III decarboxylase
MLGGHSCIGGGFPVSTILTGTVQKVEADTKKLLDDAAGDGGFIMSIGCALDEAKEDTLKAFIKVSKEYGKY